MTPDVRLASLVAGVPREGSDTTATSSAGQAICSAHADEVGRDLAREEGTTLAEAVGEMRRAAALLRYYAGQTLEPDGESRVIVEREALPELSERLVAIPGEWPLGDPLDERTKIGPSRRLRGSRRSPDTASSSTFPSAARAKARAARVSRERQPASSSPSGRPCASTRSEKRQRRKL